MYQNILINVHTAQNVILIHCEHLPLSRIYDSALVVFKQVIVLQSTCLEEPIDLKYCWTPAASEIN